MKSKLLMYLGGLCIGVVNGLFGAGGGIIAVPVLKKAGLSEKNAHANAVAVILPISILSAVIYLLRGSVKISDASPYIMSGLIGAVAGTVILKKIAPDRLKKIFGIFVIYAGVRLLLR